MCCFCLFTPRCVTCRKVPPEVTERLCSTIEDRCRVPWKGGAVRLRMDIVCPIILVPCSILLASISPAWTIIAFTGTLGLLFVCYRLWRRRTSGRRRTHVFFMFAIMSISTMCYTFLSIVVGFREVLLWEVMLLFAMLLAMTYHIIQARHDPGIILPEPSSGPTRRRLYSSSEENASLSEFEVLWVDSRPIQSKFCICFLNALLLFY